MKTERPPPPFVKTFHKIPVFFKGWLPLGYNINGTAQVPAGGPGAGVTVVTAKGVMDALVILLGLIDTDTV